MSSRGVNKVILVGNCGKDPETRYTPSGTAVSSLTLATTESWKDKNTGEKQDKTEWHQVVFFGKLAEIVGEYVKKGSQIYVEGSLTTEKWTDKSGNDRYTTKIKANEMQMLGGKSEGQGAPAQSNEKAGHQASNNAQAPAYSGQDDKAFKDDEIDDIPW